MISEAETGLNDAESPFMHDFQDQYIGLRTLQSDVHNLAKNVVANIERFVQILENMASGFRVDILPQILDLSFNEAMARQLELGNAYTQYFRIMEVLDGI